MKSFFVFELYKDVILKYGLEGVDFGRMKWVWQSVFQIILYELCNKVKRYK